MKLAATLTFLLAASAWGVDFTLNPLEDTFVTSSNPNSSYGTAGQVAVSASGLPKGEFNVLLKFDLAAAKASFDSTLGAGLWAIQAITLRLTNTTPNNAFFNGNGAGTGGTNVNTTGDFTLTWMQNDGWVAGSGSPNAGGMDGITFSTLPNFLGAADETLATFRYTAASSGNFLLSLPLRSSFLADATAGNRVSLLARPADSAVTFGVNSVNFNTPANHPLLTVTAVAVPEAGAGTLLAGAFAGWFARRRRRHGSAA